MSVAIHRWYHSEGMWQIGPNPGNIHLKQTFSKIKISGMCFASVLKCFE